MTRIDAYRHWSDGGHSLLEGVFISLRYINITCAGGTNGIRVVTACSILIERKNDKVHQTFPYWLSGKTLEQNVLSKANTI